MPSILSLLVLISSDQKTLFQLLRIRFSCSKALFNRAIYCAFDSFTVFTFLIALKSSPRNFFLTAVGENSSCPSKFITFMVTELFWSRQWSPSKRESTYFETFIFVAVLALAPSFHSNE